MNYYINFSYHIEIEIMFVYYMQEKQLISETSAIFNASE